MINVLPAARKRAAWNWTRSSRRRRCTDSAVPRSGCAYRAVEAYSAPAKVSSASPRGSARNWRMSDSRSALSRSTSRSGNAGTVTISASSDMASSNRCRSTLTWTPAISQSASEETAAPRCSSRSVSSAAVRRVVPSSSARAVRLAMPSRPVGSLMAPASATTATVTIGRSRIGATISARPFASVRRSTRGKW